MFYIGILNPSHNYFAQKDVIVAVNPRIQIF